MCFLFFFFFSSRRRHTRSKRHWSSDVCSSDLNHRRSSSVALANDAILATAGSGATLATHSPGGSNTTEYPVVMPANNIGFIGETMPTYGLTIPQLQTANDSYQWELFNHPSSGKTLTLRGLWPLPSLDIANAELNPERYSLF